MDTCLPLTCVTLELLLENRSSDKIPSRVFSQPGMREAGEVWTNRETRENRENQREQGNLSRIPGRFATSLNQDAIVRWGTKGMIL